MSRDYRIYLEDIEKAIAKVQQYTSDLSFEGFAESDLRIDAVLRNLEVIGEAVKKVPQSLKRDYPDVEWKKIAGLRDILVHEYFGVDLEIIWDVIENHLPVLRGQVERMIRHEE